MFSQDLRLYCVEDLYLPSLCPRFEEMAPLLYPIQWPLESQKSESLWFQNEKLVPL